jgi:hypothetical protein
VTRETTTTTTTTTIIHSGLFYHVPTITYTSKFKHGIENNNNPLFTTTQQTY